MGAAEQQRVDVCVDDGTQQSVGEQANAVALDFAAFDELDETRAGARRQLDVEAERSSSGCVGAGIDRPDGADHTDASAPAGLLGRDEAGLDHADDRDVEFVAELVESGRRRGVAGDDQQLRPMFVAEKATDLQGEVADFVQVARAVGVPARVSEIDEILIRQEIDEGACNGQSAEPTVEHRDGPTGHFSKRTVPARCAAGGDDGSIWHDRPMPGRHTMHPSRALGRAVRWLWGLLRELKAEWADDGITDLAAATSFFTILSIPAATLAFVTGLGSLEGLLGADFAEDARREVVDYVATTFASETLTNTVSGLFDDQRSGLLTVSLVVALVSMTRGFAGLVRALDAAYDLDHHRSWIDTRLTGFVVGVSTLAFAATALWFIYALWPTVGDSWYVAAAGQLLVAASLIVWAATIFHVAPDHSTPWKYDRPGAVVTAVLWFLLVRGFAIYVSVSGNTNGAVGAAGGALLAFTLVYLINLSLLVGAELNGILADRAGVAQPPRRLHHRVTTRIRLRRRSGND